MYLYANITNTCFIRLCSLNPNSGDTGGLLDYDFLTPIPTKLELLAKVQPNPTFVSAKTTAGQYCITPGAYVNPKCDKGRTLIV